MTDAPAGDALAAARENELPRRIRMEEWTAAEWAIYAAVQVVERVGADVRLTDGVRLLQEARDRVADYVDGVKPESVYQQRADQLAAARAAGATEAKRALALTAGFLEHVADGYRDLARFENERGESDEATEWLARAAHLDEWRRDEIGPLLRARAPSSGTEAQAQ